MLGALSLPSVSTGFTSDNKSMVPVSIQDMAIKVQNMSPLQSMQEVFFDIRDGIDNLGKVFSDKISGLNKHLAFRLETLNTTMSTIGNIASRDLDLEETQTNIDIENEKDEDKEKSLAGPTGGSFFTDEFKGKFSSALNRMKNLSFVESLIALGAGLALLTFNFDKIASVIGSTVKFFDEEIIPRGKAFISSTAEYGKNLFDGFFGKTGLFTVIFDGLTNLDKSIEKGDTKEALLAVSDTFIKSTLSIISLAGTSILGLLKVGIKTVNPDADVSKLDEIITFFNDLPGKAIKKLEADQIEFDKVLEEEGKVAAAGVLLRQTYDNYIANTLNGISKAFGIILRPIISDESYKRYMTDDYSFANVKSELGKAFDKLDEIFNTMQDSVRVFSNGLIDSVNEYLPDFMKISKIPKKDDQFEIETLASMEKQKLITPEQYEPGGFMYKKYIEQREKVIEIDPSVVIPNNSFERDFGVDANVGDIIDGTYKMEDKTKEIKTLTSESVVDNNSSIVAPIFDNKSITTNNSNSQTVTVTDQRVDSMETSSNALLSYFRQ